MSKDGVSEKQAGVPRRVMISLKYDHDQVIERSLSAYLKRAGYETFHHKGTDDLLRRAELLPVISDGPSMVFRTPAIPGRRQADPPVGSPDLIRFLVDLVCSHPALVVVWSAPYAASFWCLLEMQTAVLARKPMVLICSDNHSLSGDAARKVRQCPHRIVEVSADYRTSAVSDAIEGLFPAETVPVDKGAIFAQLSEFCRDNYSETSGFERITPAERARCEELLMVLRNAEDRGELHPAIATFLGCRLLEYPELKGESLDAVQRLLRSGQRCIDDGFRRYLEAAALGTVRGPLEGWYYTYLLGEVLDYTFLSPGLPRRLEEYYVNRIAQALDPPELSKVEALIDDLVGECLFTREFVEHFGHMLKEASGTIGHLESESYWELCRSRIPEAT